jgi:hypothetical protein
MRKVMLVFALILDGPRLRMNSISLAQPGRGSERR